jgi:hypothetical protein
MQTVTLKVGSAGTGRDYATLALAWAAIPADLVVADQSYVIELYNDSEFIQNSQITLSGKTTDSTHTITVRPAASQGFTNNANVVTNALRYNIANGVGFKGTLNGVVMIQVSNAYTTVEGLQIDVGGTNTCAAIVVSNDTAVVQNCLIEYSGTDTRTDPITLTSFATSIHAGTFRNSVIVLKAANSYGGRCYNTTAALIENVTVVRLPSLARGQYGFYGNYGSFISSKTFRNVAVFGADFTMQPTYGTYDHCASDGAMTVAGAGHLQNVAVANVFVNTTSDLRLKAGAPLIDVGAAPGATNTVTINGNRQMGTSADIGAWEYPQSLSAPLGKITSITVVGNKSTIAGTFTGTVTGGQASITPIVLSGNNAVAQGPLNMTIGSGTFTIDFNGCKVGKYSVTATLTNSAYNVQASNDVGGFEIEGGKALTVVQDPIAGQIITVHGTCSNATSGFLDVPPAASNPNGAVEQVAALTINTAVTPNTFTASATLAPGNYDPGKLTFTNADGTSLPFGGMSAVTIYAISGNPEAPAQETVDTTPPVMPGTMSISNVTATSMLAQWTAGTDNIGVVAYEFSQDDGATWVDIGNTLSKQLTSLAPSTLYKLRVRAVDPGDNRSNELTAQDTTLPASSGGPTPGARTVTLSLFTPADASAANLSGLRWAWFDQVTPDLFVAPTDKGTLETTDAGGTLTIPLPNSQLAVGAVGWLIVTDSSGNPATLHNAFSGPVVVA